MIGRWRAARARRRDDKAVVVTAVLAYVGPLTVTRLRMYVGGSFGSLYSVLISLEGCGRIESEWQDPTGPYPRRRIYQHPEVPDAS